MNLVVEGVVSIYNLLPSLAQRSCHWRMFQTSEYFDYALTLLHVRQIHVLNYLFHPGSLILSKVFAALNEILPFIRSQHRSTDRHLCLEAEFATRRQERITTQEADVLETGPECFSELWKYDMV